MSFSMYRFLLLIFLYTERFLNSENVQNIKKILNQLIEHAHLKIQLMFCEIMELRMPLAFYVKIVMISNDKCKQIVNMIIVMKIKKIFAEYIIRIIILVLMKIKVSISEIQFIFVLINTMQFVLLIQIIVMIVKRIFYQKEIYAIYFKIIGHIKE